MSVALAVDAADAPALADALLLLMDGAFAAARMYPRRSPAAQVAAAARVLVEAHTRNHPTTARGKAGRTLNRRSRPDSAQVARR